MSRLCSGRSPTVPKGPIVLDNGDSLPAIPAIDRDGNDVVIADLIDGAWGVVLFYRGHW